MESFFYLWVMNETQTPKMMSKSNTALLARIANKSTSELIEWNNELVFKIRAGRFVFPDTEATVKLIQDELLNRGI